MKIAICDDEACFVKTIYNYLWDEQKCSIDTFLNPVDLWASYQAGKRYDVIFCDILMEPLDGIKLARNIRTLDQNAILVYLTSNLDYAPLGYEVNAFRYLLKPIQKDSFLQIMNIIHEKLKQEKKLLFETSLGSFLVPETSIQYMEVLDKEVQIFSENDSFYLKKGLNEIEEMLTSSLFFRIHRKYLIHLDHVLEYDSHKVTLDCGRTLPISRRRSKLFQQSMKSFIQGVPL